MDSNNWRPTKGGEPPMDTADWRTQLQSESRHRIVNKIMETLKRHLPFSGQEGLRELKKIAVRFEEKIYTVATSQSDYLRKISLKMLTMENKSNPMLNAIQSNSAVNSKNSPDPDLLAFRGVLVPMPLSLIWLSVFLAVFGFSSSSDSTAGNANGGDWQEEIYQKIKSMKEMYFVELLEMYQKISGKLQQHDSLPQQPKNELLDKFKMFKTMLERFISFLQLSKRQIVPAFKDKLAPYEKQIISVLNSKRPRKPVSSIPTQGLPRLCMKSSSDSTAGNANGGDWQEEIYQKIKSMKEMYFVELLEMYQKISGKLQQHDSLPQQPKNELLDKFKMFKTMLERFISFLQLSKSQIVPAFKEKLAPYEKQIISVLNSKRPRKPVSSIPTQGLPPPHMHLMQQSQQQPQSQMTQMQPPHENEYAAE
ncbi:hypothetical protein LguiB_020491 [Lonicera macranthoides]